MPEAGKVSGGPFLSSQVIMWRGRPSDVLDPILRCRMGRDGLPGANHDTKAVDEVEGGLKLGLLAMRWAMIRPSPRRTRSPTPPIETAATETAAMNMPMVKKADAAQDQRGPAAIWR